jgi:hypothetical protein
LVRIRIRIRINIRGTDPTIRIGIRTWQLFGGKKRVGHCFATSPLYCFSSISQQLRQKMHTIVIVYKKFINSLL